MLFGTSAGNFDRSYRSGNDARVHDADERKFLTESQTGPFMDLARAERLLSDLAADSAMVRLHYSELEALVAWCMEAVYALAESGEDNDRKTRLVAVEYKARLLIERFRKAAVN